MGTLNENSVYFYYTDVCTERECLKNKKRERMFTCQDLKRR